jgi:DNA-binding transcriptional MerR regulator
MTALWKSLWTLDELQERAAQALAVIGEAPVNGRVRAVPDQRTIRYYTTLGLLDRPAAMQGRTAFYGRRHLLQLVAIKRLQARGLSLAELQQQLLGLTDAALADIARLPANLEESAPVPQREECAPPERPAFWKQAPAPPPDGTAEPEDARAALPLQGVPLDDDLLLLLSPERPLEPEDIEAIRAAAAPLLELVEERRLCRPRRERRAP